jgi:hypothetical protein
MPSAFADPFSTRWEALFPDLLRSRLVGFLRLYTEMASLLSGARLYPSTQHIWVGARKPLIDKLSLGCGARFVLWWSGPRRVSFLKL